MRCPRFETRLGHLGFVVDKAALGQVVSKYLDFPCSTLAIIHHPGLYNRAVVADVPSASPLHTRATAPSLLELQYTQPTHRNGFLTSRLRMYSQLLDTQCTVCCPEEQYRLRTVRRDTSQYALLPAAYCQGRHIPVCSAVTCCILSGETHPGMLCCLALL
jgi:hypothetical protein